MSGAETGLACITGNPKLVVACVGTATGDALVKAGVEPAFVPSKATGKTLVSDSECLDKKCHDDTCFAP